MTKINAEEYKKALDEFSARYVPCGIPTQYEKGFLDGLSFAIRYVRFFQEDEDGQITLEELMTRYE